MTGTVDATGNFNLKGAYHSGTPVTVSGAIIDTSGGKVANGIVKVGTTDYGSFADNAGPTIAAGTGRVQLTLGSGNTFSASNGTGTRSVNSSTGATSYSLSASRNMGAGSYPEDVRVSLSKASGIHAGDIFVVGTDNVSVQHFQQKSLTVFQNETSVASNPPGTVKVTGVSATSISLLLSNVSMQATSNPGSGNVGSSYTLNGTFSANGIQQP